MDVGCGDGNYLNVNAATFTIGCDRSESLCKLAACKSQQNTNTFSSLSSSSGGQILVCDNLALPFRSGICDAVISIGVIHHMSTHKRRVRAVQELARLLVPGGKLMIYVWALEQRLRKV